MEWSEKTMSFEKEKPKSSPMLNVRVELMKPEHRRFSKLPESKVQTGSMKAITDTGCQTTTSGLEILKVLNIPKESLIKTRHGIVGITDTMLKIVGTLFVKISILATRVQIR